MRLVVVILLLASSIYPLQRMIDGRWGGKEKLVEELMYFPTGNLLKKLVLGYDELVADLVWLRMIQYYGQHRQSDKRYDYLAHILDVLTDLDPRFIHAYTFGALLLTDDAKNPARGLAILEKGASYNPQDWRLPFMSGFINYVFLADYDRAASYFMRASSLPDSPDFTKRFAAFIYDRAGKIELSLELWYNLYRRTQNEYERLIALRYIKRIHAEMLNQLVRKFKEEYRRYPSDLAELVKIGWIDSIPRPPDGSFYYFDRVSKEVRCSN